MRWDSPEKDVYKRQYQGKQSYASKTYNLTDPDWKDGQTLSLIHI